MDNLTDQQLLREYGENRSETAFAELVRRHVDLVYSAALRMVCDTHLAQDVTQSVFLALAQNGRRLTDRPVLSGWLHRTAQYLASKAVRTDARRRAREQEAASMNEMLSTEPDTSWEQLAPRLDAALGELNEADRDALLLRYFERKSAREMAQILGLSDEAAQKRVSRAIERVREIFSKHGVAVGASGLAALLSANAVQSAPIGLTTTISTATALSGAAIKSTTLGLTKTLVMTTLQKSLITVAIAAAVGTSVYEKRRAQQLEARTQSLQQQQDSLSAQNRQLQTERDEAVNQLAATRNENAQARGVPRELLKLRAEVTKLRGDSQAWAKLKEAQASDPTGAAAKSWLTRVDQLKQGIERMPDKRIPELQLLTEQNWLEAVKDTKQLQTDADVRQALNNLRNGAKIAFGDMARDALRKYSDANGGLLPTDWSQVKSYFETPVDDAIFQRWALLQTGKLSDAQGQTLFREKAPPVDDQYDSTYEFGMNTTSSYSMNNPGDVVGQALVQFAGAHDGQLPTDQSQLVPYLSRPLAAAEIQKVLAQVPGGVATLDQLKAYGFK
jgi:RNA polymerase sigma factor (sigma-70 family)